MYFNADINHNFWDVNKDWAVMKPFSDFIETTGKRRSSRIMWSIYLCYHPLSSFYKKYNDLEQRQNAINEDFNGVDSRVNFEDFKKIIDEFVDLLPESLKSLAHWEKTLKEYDTYLDGITFTNHFKTKTDGLQKKKLLWDLYMAAKLDYDAELLEGRNNNRAGYTGSMLENNAFSE